MKFDLNNMQIRLHSIPQRSGGMAWEAAVSATRLAGMDYECTPDKTMGGLADTLIPWLLDAGPQVALQVRLGGLWAPDLVGSEITLAVLGSCPTDARARLEVRSRELAMWLDVNHQGESWVPAELASDVDIRAIPLQLVAAGRQALRACPFCHSDDGATERFIEVSRRTHTGLQFTLRSQGLPVEVGDEIRRLRTEVFQRRRRTRLMPEVEHCESLLAQLERLELCPAARPIEMTMAAVGLDPMDNMVRFAAIEAASELGAQRSQAGPEVVVPGTLGVHAGFRFFNGAKVRGIDTITGRALLRWVTAIDDPREEGEGRSKKGGQGLIDPRLLFQAS